MMLRNIRKDAILLGGFALVTVGLLALTQAGTAQRIEENRLNALRSALGEVLPDALHDNALLATTYNVESPLLGNHGKPREAYLATLKGTPSAVIFQTVASEGYNGNIELLVSVNWQGEVVGVRALAHKETPGLGDRIDYAKSHWVDSFIGKSLANTAPDQWQVRKDGGLFDAFTGATITPRAVVKGVQQTLLYFDEVRPALEEHLRAQTDVWTHASDSEAQYHGETPEHSQGEMTR